jgi:LytTr DNA-binding domain
VTLETFYVVDSILDETMTIASANALPKTSLLGWAATLWGRMQEALRSEPPVWAEWRRGGSWIGMLAAAMLVVAVTTTDVWTTIHSQPELGMASNLWQVVSWEYTSALSTILLLPGFARLARHLEKASLVEPGRMLVTLMLAMISYAVAHIALFIALRRVIYGLAGSNYRFGGIDAWLYELPKDCLSFFILLGLVAAGRRFGRRNPASAEQSGTEDMIVFKIGNQLLHLRPSEILAVKAAGNYVEVLLDDGRVPLVRTTLARLERRLEASGFLRAHRSWLVNPMQVREALRTPSGDHRILLRNGTEVPLSRRYPAVLEQLMAGCGRSAS